MRNWVFAAFLTICCQSVFAANRDVCPTCTYTTIQDAIANGSSGDTIRVVGGTFTEDINTSISGLDIRIDGGYNATFSARDDETIVEGRFQISSSSASSLTIDRVTVANASAQAIYISGTTTDLTVTNSIVYGAASYGIYGYNPGNITVDGCEIYSNGAYGGIGVQRLSNTKTITLTNNIIHSNTCFYCAGIEISGINSSDKIEGNTIYDNYIGIRLLATAASPTPLIAHNRVYQNSEYGMIASHGTPTIRNNVFYKNTKSGIYYYSVDSPLIINNLFAKNGPYGYGVQFGTGSGSPVIKNNIFYYQFHGLYMDSGISVTPASVNHNVFFHDQILDYRDLRTGYNEAPGDYNDLNHFSYTNSNLSLDPRFVDPDNDNYTLQADSFLIDEGDPTSDYSAEPATNGSRVNIGPQGNSSVANTSPAAPTITNLLASQSGDDIAIGFDTNTATHALWIELEYYDGATYQSIPATAISGTSYEIGYQSGRITSGSGRALTWVGADSIFGLGNHTTRIRATVAHGGSSASIVSSDIQIGFNVPTPTPTATPDPTTTPTPTPAPTPTATPTPEPEPEADPIAPTIHAKKAKFRRGAFLRLPVTINDSDSANVNVTVTVRLHSVTGKLIKRNLGSSAVTLPVTNPYLLDLGKVNLNKGKGQYCVRARDDTDLLSVQSCAALIVTSKID
jgi:parallel beta-helix repeat protein